MQPETRYADSGGVNIAYQVLGEGSRDLVLVPGWASNIEVYWEEPALARFLTRPELVHAPHPVRQARHGPLGSDHGYAEPRVRMDDVRAVMDAVGSDRAALFGLSEGGSMCALFSATYPQRTTALIMWAAFQGGPGRRIIPLG